MHKQDNYNNNYVVHKHCPNNFKLIYISLRILLQNLFSTAAVSTSNPIAACNKCCSIAVLVSFFHIRLRPCPYFHHRISEKWSCKKCFVPWPFSQWHCHSLSSHFLLQPSADLPLRSNTLNNYRTSITFLKFSFKKMCCWQLCQINNIKIAASAHVQYILVWQPCIPLVCDDPFVYFLISGNREKSPSQKIYSTEMFCFCCSRYRATQISAPILTLIRPALQRQSLHLFSNLFLECLTALLAK